MRNPERDAEARRKAEAALAQRKKLDDAIVAQREKERAALAEKVTRLRELRLAKEAAEAEEKAKAKPQPQPLAFQRKARGRKAG